MSTLSRWIIALGAAAVLPAWSLDVGNAYWVCDSGNCANGVGRARIVTTNVAYEGQWSGGKSIAGQPYTLTHAAAPGRTWKAVFGTSGLQESGDMLFGLGATTALPVFTGSYAHVDHPFAQQKVAVPRRGQLDNGLGFVYAGRFEYLPAKITIHTRLISGAYIFFGTVTDTDDGSKETGLFVTDVQPNGMLPHFQKANPAWLAKLQQRYQEELAVGKVEMAEQESSRQWREVFGVITKLGVAVATGGLSQASQTLAGETAMGLMNNMLKNQDGKVSVEDATNKAIEQVAAGDEESRRQLRAALK